MITVVFLREVYQNLGLGEPTHLEEMDLDWVRQEEYLQDREVFDC